MGGDNLCGVDFSQASDSELLAAAPRRGEAFGEFYRRHEEAVLVFMLRRTRSSDVAADLAAEVFAAALHGVRRYRCDQAPPAAWLFGIARNVLAVSHRKARVSDALRVKLGAGGPARRAHARG